MLPWVGCRTSEQAQRQQSWHSRGTGANCARAGVDVVLGVWGGGVADCYARAWQELCGCGGRGRGQGVAPDAATAHSQRARARGLRLGVVLGSETLVSPISAYF
eukprot:423317-Rhodomonas_salina.1